MDAKTLEESLVALYQQRGEKTKCLDHQGVLEHLRSLQSTGTTAYFSDTLSQYQIEPLDFATIAFLDKYLTAVIVEAEFPEEIDIEIKKVVAAVMYAAVSEGLLNLTRGPLVSIVDHLVTLMLGWPETKGRVKDTVAQKLEDAVNTIAIAMNHEQPGETVQRARDNLLQMISEDIGGFVGSEMERINKLEQRLIDSESGQHIASKSKSLAAQALNKRMEGKVIPEKVVNFLHGVWFDSLQLIATREGVRSDNWYQALQLTETLISTVTPENKPVEQAPVETPEPSLGDGLVLEGEPVAAPEPPKEEPKKELSAGAQKLMRIIEHLPAELEKSLISIEHDKAALESALAEIEDVHVQIMQGNEVPGFEFELLSSDEGNGPNTRVSKSLIAMVNRLSTGSWFVLRQEDSEIRHIRLTLKFDETQGLLFTNRNGLKVLETSFEEFAYLMSSGAVCPLPAHGQLHKNVRFKLMATLKEKVKKDQAEEQKKKRLAAEKKQKALDDVAFLVVAVNKSEVREDLRIADALSQLYRGDEKLSLLDHTNLNLNKMSLPDVASLALPETVQVIDQMPNGMDAFKTTVKKMRVSAKLEIS